MPKPEPRRANLQVLIPDLRTHYVTDQCDACKQPITVVYQPADDRTAEYPTKAERVVCPHCGLTMGRLLKGRVLQVSAGHAAGRPQTDRRDA